MQLRQFAFFVFLTSTLIVGFHSGSQAAFAFQVATLKQTPKPILVSGPDLATAKVKQESTDLDDKADEAVQKLSSAILLPPTSTRAWLSFKDIKGLRTKLANSNLGTLGQQASIRPFIESLQQQLKDVLKKNNIQFGFEFDELEELDTGEICVAGIFPEVAGKKPTRGSHGIVVLVDVSKDKAKANKLIGNAAEKMVKRGAAREKLDINGTNVEKLSFEVKGSRTRKKRQSFATVVNGWLVGSDNEVIFREILRRAKNPAQINLAETFGGQKSFNVIAERTATDGIESDLNWYVDPFGYARLADALAQENRLVRGVESRPVEMLARAGLDAIKATGGSFSFSTAEHEVLYRAMIYGPRGEAKTDSQKRVFALLDFTEMAGQTNKPPAWVTSDASSYFTANWDLQRAFDNVGHFLDAKANKKGSWDAVLNKMKTHSKFKVDLKGMVAKLGQRITIMSVAEEPITVDSEKVVVGIKLQEALTDEEKDWLLESVGRAVEGKVKSLGGYKTIEEDPSQVADDGLPPDIMDEIDIDEFGGGDEPAAKPSTTIMSRRYFAIKNDHLLICNDKNYLKKLLLTKDPAGFAKKEDFVRIQETLGKLTDENRVRFRQFGRLDRIIKPNYEMLRRGEMADSQTLLARVLNKAMTTDDEDPQAREQKIDASDLPADFEGEVAPYLGTAGWVMEIEDNGWRFTGCVLAKGDKAVAKIEPEKDSKIEPKEELMKDSADEPKEKLEKDSAAEPKLGSNGESKK